jgi:N-methylhydantoinase A
MTVEAMAVIEPGLGEGLSTDKPERQMHVDMRYVGQGHELAIPLHDRPLSVADAARIRMAFEDRYKVIYGVTLDHVGIEITAWSLTLSAPTSLDRPIQNLDAKSTVEPAGSREAYDPEHGARLVFALYRREALSLGVVLDGPAIIAEDQTSTMVPPGWQASIAANHAIVLDRQTEGRR